MANNLLSYFYSSMKKEAQSYDKLKSRFVGSDPISNKSMVSQSKALETVSELERAGRGIFKVVLGLGFLLNLKKIARYFVNFAAKYAHIRYKSAQGKIITLKDYLLSRQPGKLSESFGDIDFDGSLEKRAAELEQKFLSMVEAVDDYIKNIGTGNNMSKNEETQTDQAFEKYSNDKVTEFIKNSVPWSKSDAAQYPAGVIFFAPVTYSSAAKSLLQIVESYEADSSGKNKISSIISDFIEESADVAKQADEIIEKISKKSENPDKNNQKIDKKSDHSINKITKYSMSDQFAKNYYKDALKGLEGNDPFMKQFYKGMASFYDEEQKFNDSRKDKYLYDLSLDQDLVQEAHPHKLYVSKGFGEGGLVENGHQAKKRMVDVARRNPSGNFKNN